MATPEHGHIEVSVLSGQAQLNELKFPLGTQAAPMSVGTGAQWVVLADRVSPVHLFLAFDGQNVHVAAAAPDLPVLLAGRSVGTEWAVAPIPCELRFGGGCMILRRATPSTPVDAGPSTMSDGGALQHAARRAIQAAKNSPNPAGAPVNTPDGSGFPREVMEVRGLTSTMPINPAAPAGARVVLPAWNTAEPRGSGAVAPRVFAASPRVDSPAAPRASAVEPPAAEPKKGYWQSASTVKKITLVLMPFAFYFSYVMLVDDPRAPPKVLVPASVGSAHRSPADVRSAPTVAAALVPPGDSGATGAADVAGEALVGRAPTVVPAAVLVAAPFLPIPKPAPTPPPVPQKGATRRTAEREALDAVAGGAFGDAARDYDALAVAHPDDPSLKEAARILRQKSGYTH
jgi:hypothetical protein